MNDSERDPPGSPSSTITDPETYGWEDVTRTAVPSPEFHHSDQSGGTNAMFTASPPQLRPFHDGPTINSKAESNFASHLEISPGESADSIMMRLSNEFSPIVEKDADTLVYLGIPPHEPGQDLFDYDHIRNHFARPYLMKSETLRRVNSSKFEKFLGPMSARTERRLKKQQVHKLVRNVDNIKFYIDLSPILNDEEAMTQLAEMSAPREALKWHQVAEQYCVQSSQIAGRDNLNTPTKPSFFTSTSTARQESEHEDTSGDEDSDVSQNSVTGKKKRRVSKAKCKPKVVRPIRLCELPLEEEYTSLRHHTTTSRLLHAIAGNDPKLNSAVKAWSFCMLAKYFDCAQHYIISPWIEGWLLQGNNLNFVQVNPYTAYRMAMAIQSVWLMRCTFAIIVGKRAMSIASQQMDKDYALFDSLDDDEINRIDHASAALYQRVKSSFEQIMSGMWMANAYGIKQLNQVQVKDRSTQQIVDNVKRGLLEYVQRRICIANTNKADNILNDEDDVIFTKNSDIYAYNQLPLHLRVLTGNFWRCLRAQDLNIDVATDPESLHPMLNLVNESGLMESTLKLNYVSKRMVVTLIHEVNRVCFPNRYFSPSNAPIPRQVEEICPKDTGNTSPYKAKKTVENTSPTTPTKSGMGAPNTSRPSTMHTGRSHQSQTQYYQGNLTDGDRKLLDTLRAAQAAPPLETPYAAPNQTKSTEADGGFDDSWWSDDETVDSNDTPQASRSQKHVQFKDEDMIDTIDASSVMPAPKFTLQTSAPRKPDQTSKFIAENPIVHGQNHLGSESLSFRPRKRTSDVAALPEEVQQAQQETYSTNHVLTTFPESYRAKVGRFGITPSASLNETAKVDQAQATATTTWVGSDRLLPVRSDIPDISYGIRNEKYGNVNPSMPFRQYPVVNQNFNEVFSSSDEDNSPSGAVFLPSNMLSDLTRSLKNEVTSLLTAGYHRDGTCDFDIPVNEVKTLLSLGEDEWKYLPLWAGGLDDGSGGVFSDGMEIPDAPDVDDGGFRGGAMGIIPGVGSSLGGSMAGSEFEDVATEVAVSTVGKASRIATEGRTATVISLDE